jgi:cytochrome c oxidase assembly factor CtaG
LTSKQWHPNSVFKPLQGIDRWKSTMNPTAEAFVRSWPAAPWLAAMLLLSGAVYLRGWLLLHRRDPLRWHSGRLAAFGGALVAIYMALASPIEPFASLLLEMHMLQHLLLMLVVPPLMWLSAPLFPLLRGLPEPARTVWVAPVLRWRPLRVAFARLTHPLVAWPVFVAATWLWHLPPAYELALRSPWWHHVQHASFLAAGLVFWYPVVRPYPARPRWSGWILLPYLLLADVQNTVLAAWLTFSPRVLYGHYLEVPRLVGISALDDQATSGVLMWVLGSIALLVPLFMVGVSLLAPSSEGHRRRAALMRRRGAAIGVSLPDRGVAARLAARATSARVRSAGGLAGGQVVALASRAGLHATADGGRGASGHRRRPARSAGGADERRGRGPLDPLARTGGAGPAGRR